MSNGTPHVGFPFSSKMQSLSNQFLESASAGHPKAGDYFYKVILQLTEEVIDYLLVQTVAIANVNTMGQKVVNVCASTSNKASSMLSAKIYKNASPKEMQDVAELWQSMIKNTQADQSGEWYLVKEIQESLAQELDAIMAEKGDQQHFQPQDIELIMQRYESMMDVIIDEFFLRPTENVKIGMVTKKLLHLGVDGVKQASNAVIHKVVKKLDPQHLANYVDFTSQFFIRGELN
jgi:hypothetical protein